MANAQFNEMSFVVGSIAKGACGSGQVTMQHRKGLLVGVRVGVAGAADDVDLRLGVAAMADDHTPDCFYTMETINGNKQESNIGAPFILADTPVLHYALLNRDAGDATGAITVTIICDGQILYDDDSFTGTVTES